MSTTFPAMFTSFLPFEALHKTQAPIDRTNLYIYSAQGEPTSTPDPNLDACAHLYHSDRESIWSILRSYELLDVLTVASSLSHTVIFHGGPEKLAFHDSRGRRFFFQETFGRRLSDGRGLHEGRIYDGDGNHVVSTMQDGAFKLNWKSEEQMKKREQRLQKPYKL
jgi:acyl-CoA thioesterase